MKSKLREIPGSIVAPRGFRVELPAELVARVDTMTDLSELARLFDVALTAATLDDFRTAAQL